jgi:hypothetical protein
MESETPPERLPLGAWAAKLCADRYRVRLDEAVAWAEVAASADRRRDGDVEQPDVDYR